MEENKIENIQIPVTTPLVKKINYSYSRVETYKKCGYQYKIIYVDKKRPPFGNVATEFGSLIHGTEEAIANSLKENKPIDYITLKNHFIIEMNKIKNRYKIEFMQPGKNGMTYYEKAYYYLEYAIYRLEKLLIDNPNYEIIGAEVNFQFDYDDLHGFKGSVDRIIKDNNTGKYLIYDIKSYDKIMEHDELTTPLQMVIYTEAVSRQFGIDKDFIQCIYDLPLMDTYQEAGTKGYMARGLKKIDSLFEGIKNEDFEPQPSALCHWCAYCPTNAASSAEYKYLCPYFSTWQQSGDNVKDVLYEWQGKENDEVVHKLYEEYRNKSV